MLVLPLICVHIAPCTHVCVEEGRVGEGLHSYPGSWWAGYEAREGMVNMLEEANEILELKYCVHNFMLS